VAIGGGDARELDERAFLSDTMTGALSAADGTIDWWCPDRYDRDARLFGLLDPGGGAVSVTPAAPARPGRPGEQSYDGSSLVATTVLRSTNGTIEIKDACVWDGSAPPGRVVRLITALRGPVRVNVDVMPAGPFRPAREVAPWSDGVAIDGVVVRTGLAMAAGPTGVVRGAVTLDAGDRLVVTIDAQTGEPPLSPDRAAAAVERAAVAWRRVLSPARLDGPWAALASRSLLVLRALAPAGAVIDAPTTSLPHVVGSERTNDGRIVRTATVATWAVEAHRAGLTEETGEAVAWMETVLDGDLPVPDVWGLDGGPPPGERLLALRGWRRSEPVRAGVDPPEPPGAEPAAEFLSAIGELGDAAAPLIGKWDGVAAVAGWLAGNWREPGAGPWMFRGRRPPVLGSRLVARAALDAVAQVAWRRNPLDLDAALWHGARAEVEEALLAGADAGQGALGGEPPDASLLRLAWLGPWPTSDPVVAATVDHVVRHLRSGPWVLSYPPELDDGRPDHGSRPASVTATLWLARALAALGRWDDANQTMEAVSTLAGPLGLLPEWVDATSGRARGNRPSAAAHLALIGAARALARGPR
jgi:hypothetical protein